MHFSFSPRMRKWLVAALIVTASTVGFAPKSQSNSEHHTSRVHTQNQEKRKHRAHRVKNRTHRKHRVERVTIQEYANAIAQSEIVANLLCIHDGHSYNYRGFPHDPFRLSSYVQGRQNYWSYGGIDSGEGSWTDDSSAQQGGLQMDYGFQTTYGERFYHRYGNASHWPVYAQLETAYKAVVSLGSYRSWPNTRFPCGL